MRIHFTRHLSDVLSPRITETTWILTETCFPQVASTLPGRRNTYILLIYLKEERKWGWKTRFLILEGEPLPICKVIVLFSAVLPPSLLNPPLISQNYDHMKETKIPITFFDTKTTRLAYRLIFFITWRKFDYSKIIRTENWTENFLKTWKRPKDNDYEPTSER